MLIFLRQKIFTRHPKQAKIMLFTNFKPADVEKI